MIAEIISVGTELLLGQIVNTDASFVAKELSDLGINTYHQSVVGDNQEKMKKTIEIAEERSDLLILIGGLGPTQDDITKQTLSEHLDEPLMIEAGAMERIRLWFSGSNREMTSNNKKQALYFQNGRMFKNINGMAIGSFIKKNGTSYLLLPGPPHELKKMFHSEVTPYLKTLLTGERQFIVSKTLRFFGIGESTLVNKLQSLIDHQTNPTIAPYAGELEVSLRITASGPDQETCSKLIEKTSQQVMDEVGEYIYGEGEDTSLEQVVSDLLREKNIVLSAAESLTAGLFQSQLVSVPKSSEVFLGGMVAYAEKVKQEVLGVPESILKEKGMVSEECAISMAERCLEIFHSDIAISFTGVAGPDSLEGNPPGTVWIGISQKNKKSFAKKYRFMRTREGNRRQSVMQGLDLLRKTLQ
ncbi:competence/damage-inducible protein A [Jeotgalibaca sp. MA1X17-3]|uniref:competence/damage-inducible protein A n=1 Tax=Jeotgalibaca sp. MA1X17-3 TaxID=2908211 RepID=UPI001F2F7989|nr:competence/damage-inducible protein A [Jeotgalibaca sp. MA1X17-3]UJF14871.1 competence/damage-inducible protein A [Jeotgalibaca sp. MA1X17-3]